MDNLPVGAISRHRLDRLNTSSNLKKKKKDLAELGSNLHNESLLVLHTSDMDLVLNKPRNRPDGHGPAHVLLNRICWMSLVGSREVRYAAWNGLH